MQTQTNTQPNKRAASDLDRTIGGNIKRVREATGHSQVDLANSLDISFQQVQKYESARNRIAASRLATIAKLWGVPLTVFLTPADQPIAVSARRGVSS
jgi:transcriptional regulator with XRE-family HTH domain